MATKGSVSISNGRVPEAVVLMSQKLRELHWQRGYTANEWWTMSHRSNQFQSLATVRSACNSRSGLG